MQLDRPLARRIDRLARRAHAFHRFAHHPLCDRYGSELITLRRRTRVCRGCALSLLGASAGAAAGWLASTRVVQAPSLTLTVALASVSVPAALIVARSVLRPSRRRGRFDKLATRFLPCAVFAALCSHALQAPSGSSIGFALLGASCAAWLLGRYRQRGPDRSPCQQCPERDTTAVCSGMREIVRAERAFRRRAARLIDATAAAAHSS